jgi:hypothetical protein
MLFIEPIVPRPLTSTPRRNASSGFVAWLMRSHTSAAVRSPTFG